MKNSICILILFLLAGCASAPISRGASEYLLTSDKSITNALQDLKAKLEENKYKVKKMDATTGILLLVPRKYSFDKGGKKIAARQIVQMRQEGGSVKLRINYECKYLGVVYETCYRDDQESNVKINRIEPALVELVRPTLMKHNDVKKEEAPSESLEDWGKDAEPSSTK